MKNILWLPSWYPSRLDRFTGDFVQRHAQALALYQSLVVLYLVKDAHGLVTNDVSTEITDTNGLKEIIVYYKPRQTGFKPIDKILSIKKYLSVYKTKLKQLIAETGAPAYIHVHVPMKAGVLALWCKRKYGIPFIVTEHWCAYNLLNPDNFFKKGLLFRRLSKKVFESAAMVTTVCESNRKELLSLFSIRQSMVINNVINEQLFYPQASKGNPCFTFVHVSTLHPQKNIGGLLNGLHLLKAVRADWRCIIVGPYQPYMQQLAGELGLDNQVIWTGELPYEQVATVVRGADCLVMFSKYENSPCTIIEALAAGLPVVSSNVGGIPELIDEANGLLVNSGDVMSLARAMGDMMQLTNQYDNDAIARAAAARFSYKTIGAKLSALYV
ncbi:MAG TPA: glycosyltransferase [Chitinophagaceae bacterium]|nr:glycosyltransferase [Chitinophagaceae bacterium]